MSRFDINFFDYFNYVSKLIEARPLLLGGGAGYSGGVGGKPGGFVGQLPQVYVAYDISEEESNYTPINYSGASLIDNLNHIRYRIANLEGNVLSVEEDNVLVDSDITVLDFRGDIAVTTGDPGEVIITVISSGGGGVSDHGLLTGLLDDDHPQYLTSGRADALFVSDADLNTVFYQTLNRFMFSNPGDLITTSGFQTATILSVGTDGQVLTADSSELLGLKWTTVSGLGTGTSDVQVLDDLDDVYLQGPIPANLNVLRFIDEYTYTWLDTGAEKAAITASASNNNGTSANMIDANDSSIWNSAAVQYVGMWVKFNMGSAVTLVALDIYQAHPTDYAPGFVIDGSTTGAFIGEQKTLVSTEQSPGFGYAIITFDQYVDAYQYYRIRITNPNTSKWWQVNEVDFYKRAGVSNWEATTTLPVYTNNTSNPPTLSELNSAVGTPSTVKRGFAALLNDNNAGTNVYIIASDGTNWWHSAMTKAT